MDTDRSNTPEVEEGAVVVVWSVVLVDVEVPSTKNKEKAQTSRATQIATEKAR